MINIKYAYPCHLVILVIGLAGCQHGQQTSSVCEGSLLLGGIERPGLRQDAHHTISQFAALNRDVEVDGARTTPDRIVIQATGGMCDRFARSFLESDMPEFQGLRYRQGPPS